MKKKSDRNVPVILFLFLSIVFICGGIRFEKPLFLIFGAIAFLFSAASFLINKYMKQYADKAFVPAYFLFAGTLIISAGIAMSEKPFFLIGGLFVSFAVAFFIDGIFEIRHTQEKALSDSTLMPSEIVRLFAVRKGKSYDIADWYCIDKRTGKAYVFSSDIFKLTDFDHLRQQACSKYACCFTIAETKKRGFWKDFSEENWWKKLKMKFDKEEAANIPAPDSMTPKTVATAAKASLSDSESSGTFVCTVCKKEKSIRYMHHAQICADCHKATPSSAKPPLPSNTPGRQPMPAPSKEDTSTFFLGKYDFTSEDTQKIKTTAMRYFPSQLDKYELPIQLVSFLPPVMETSIVHLSTDWLWEGVKRANPDAKEEAFKQALVKTVLTIDKSLNALNTEHLMEMVHKASPEELLKAWLTLDYCAYCLKSEYTRNIQHYRDYIQNALLQLEKNASACVSDPVKFKDTEVHIDTTALFAWKTSHPFSVQYEKSGALMLTKNNPVIRLFEDDEILRDYCLETEKNEDFTGKYFLISVRLTQHGTPSVMAVQVDGFVSDTPDERQMTLNDIGYRMEVCFLNASGDAVQRRYEMLRGQDLEMKALKYPGRTTPANVRLIGYCPECQRSFAFHGYAFYMAQDDVVYSDDGLDVCTVSSYEIDKEAAYTVDEKTFRYYNSFNCPHCQTPYIDYKKYPEIKVFGVSGCVLLGKKHYKV